jgi:polyisoprenoid-binding protein YceI
MSTMTRKQPAATRERVWTLDQRSTVEFKVPTFWGLSTVVGQFRDFDGVYLRRTGGGVIELTVEVASLDTANAFRDKHLRSRDFFDVAAYPRMRFTSTLVKELDGALGVTGYLEAVGRRVPLALQATVREEGDELELELTSTIDQRELGMTHSPLGMIRSPAVVHVNARLRMSSGVLINSVASLLR